MPSEHSSGESRFRGGITKAGNKHLRKLLVEAAWHYKGASRSPKDLAKGQVVDAATRRHANAGVRRLVDRRRSMDDAGKQSSVANVAVARELACWCLIKSIYKSTIALPHRIRCRYRFPYFHATVFSPISANLPFSCPQAGLSACRTCPLS